MSWDITPSSAQGSGFKWVVWSSLVVFILLLALFVRANSYFIADDYDHFIQAAHLPLLQMLSTPIDVHYAPLHNLFSALILYSAPLDFDVALLVLLSFHGLSVWLLYKLLQALSDSPANLLIVLLYACNPFLLHPLIWWSAGIHRFPYIFLCLASLHAYVHYRQSRRPLHLACCYLAFFLAFGFYSKAILIPLYILGLELCLSVRERGRLLARFAPGGVMLLVSIGYVLWYLNFAPVMRQGPAPSIAVAGDILLLNFKVMAGVLSFHRHDAPSVFNLALVVLLLLGILYSLSKDRRALPIWLVLFACVGVNFAMVAASGRGQMFGAFLAFALRYYFEVMFLVAIFGGMLLGVLRTRSEPAVKPRHWVAWVVCVFYLSALSWVGSSYFFALYDKSNVATAHYMGRLLTDLDGLPAERPLLLAEASFPGYVYGDFINTLMPMAKVLPLRYPHLAIVPRAQADYAVDETGAVVALHAAGARAGP